MDVDTGAEASMPLSTRRSRIYLDSFATLETSRPRK